MNASLWKWLNLSTNLVFIGITKEFLIVFMRLYLHKDNLMIKMLLLLVRLRSLQLALVERNMKWILPIATILDLGFNFKNVASDDAANIILCFFHVAIISRVLNQDTITKNKSKVDSYMISWYSLWMRWHWQQ